MVILPLAGVRFAPDNEYVFWLVVFTITLPYAKEVGVTLKAGDGVPPLITTSSI